MIAANYTMDLYCCCPICDNPSGWPRPKFAQYIGRSWADVVRQARADGWRISKDKCSAYAPGHTKQKAKKGSICRYVSMTCRGYLNGAGCCGHWQSCEKQQGVAYAKSH